MVCHWVVQREQTKDQTHGIDFKEDRTTTKRNVARTNMVPTTVALRRMLSWVPTPIALQRLHVLWFRFQHTQVWVWAPC